MVDEEDKYLIPLQDQRIFGAGIKGKRVHFIPPTTDYPTDPSKPSKPSKAGDRYLSIVLPTSRPDLEQNAFTGQKIEVVDPRTPSTTDGPLCQICNLPISPYAINMTSSLRAHEASLAHQVCLTHSHPPSHLDRNRQGLKYLSSYGWDPDSRLGLGASGHGIRVPIKPRAKNDTVGLGATPLPEDKRDNRRLIKKEEKLDAKKVRKREAEIKQKRNTLQELFYGDEDLERYLGPRR